MIWIVSIVYNKYNDKNLMKFCCRIKKHLYICTVLQEQIVLNKNAAGMVKLVDTPDLGSGAARCEGSSPFTRTKTSDSFELEVFYFIVIFN